MPGLTAGEEKASEIKNWYHINLYIFILTQLLSSPSLIGWVDMLKIIIGLI